VELELAAPVSDPPKLSNPTDLGACERELPVEGFSDQHLEAWLELRRLKEARSPGLTRRQLLPVIGAALAAATPRALPAAARGNPGTLSSAEARFVYVGTYTAPGVPPGGTHPSTAVGISVFRMDPRSGDLIPIQVVTSDNPSFLALDPTHTHLYSTNENLDGRFSAYAINPATGEPTFINTHMAFHPNHPFAYVVDELASSITAFTYDPERGAMIWRQTLSTLPADFAGTNAAAEIRIHPDGQFLYNTNRGHNSLTMYEIDGDTGRLAVIGWQSTRGAWPRGMNIDPSGTFLYAANQTTDTIVVFSIDGANGRLEPTGTVVRTPTPVDIESGGLA
jgi:6-phosphogluconolactonase